MLVHFPLIKKSSARCIHFPRHTCQRCFREAIFVVVVVVKITLSAQLGTLDHELAPQEPCRVTSIKNHDFSGVTLLVYPILSIDVKDVLSVILADLAGYYFLVALCSIFCLS